MLSGLAYLCDPEDLIPDDIPGIGMLDDAVMIELVFRELRHELEAYEDFRAYRESLTKRSVLRKAAPGVAEKIARRRVQLMARMRRMGDRDVRSDDRYLFLETLMSARKRIHLSYIGEGVKDGKPRNPAAPLAELIDTLCAMTGEQPSGRVVRHPLQPFSATYFDG